MHDIYMHVATMRFYDLLLVATMRFYDLLRFLIIYFLLVLISAPAELLLHLLAETLLSEDKCHTAIGFRKHQRAALRELVASLHSQLLAALRPSSMTKSGSTNPLVNLSHNYDMCIKLTCMLRRCAQ